MSRNTREGAQAFEGPKGFESNKLFEHGGDSEQTQEKMEIQPLGPVQGRSSRSVMTGPKASALGKQIQNSYQL